MEEGRKTYGRTGLWREELASGHWREVGGYCNDAGGGGGGGGGWDCCRELWISQ